MERFNKHLERNESVYVTVLEIAAISYAIYFCINYIRELNEVFLNGDYYESYMGAVALIYLILFSIVLIFVNKKLFRVVDYLKARKSKLLTKTTV